MKMPKFLQNKQATLKKYEGDTPQGPSYEDPVTIKGYYEQEREIVKDDDGNEVISESQFYTSEDIEIPPQSILEIGERENEVITVSRYEIPITGKFNHQEVALK